MIILITGATHSGKTRLANELMSRYKISFISQDHLKMGLIRSGNTKLTPNDSLEALTDYIWPITREIIKTAIENKQHLIIEGCYIPFSWKQDFSDEYLAEIKFWCICFSDKYIDTHYNDIIQFEGCIEDRIDDGYCTKALLKRENKYFIKGCDDNNLNFVLVENHYEETLDNILKDRIL